MQLALTIVYTRLAKARRVLYWKAISLIEPRSLLHATSRYKEVLLPKKNGITYQIIKYWILKSHCFGYMRCSEAI